MTDELNEDQKTILTKHKTEYDRKLKTFALDVAARIPAAMNGAVDDVINAAEKICDYITKSPKEWPVPSPDEAAAELAQMKSRGEAQ